MDWQVKLVRFLIEGGTQGRRQQDLIQQAGGTIRDMEVIAFLRLLAAGKKAQKYVLPGQIAVWRATKLIEKLD